MADTSMLGASPFADGGADREARGGAHICGECSGETFVNQGALSLTHQDAAGWLNYLRSWHVPNFHFQDGNVQVWHYEEAYANYEDTYHIRATRAGSWPRREVEVDFGGGIRKRYEVVAPLVG